MGEGAPSRSTVRWVNPDGTSADGPGNRSATGTSADGQAGGIDRDPIPEDYRDHVRIYFGGD
jgi:hypothetical protein